MSFPSRLYTPIDFTGDFQSPAKRIKASNVTIRSASHKNKVFVYLTQAGVEVWFFETDPGVDGEIEEFKKAVDKGDTVAKNYNFVAAMKRRLNRSTNKPAANDSNMQRTASDTDDCRYVFVRIVDTSSLKLRLAMATKLASICNSYYIDKPNIATFHVTTSFDQTRPSIHLYDLLLDDDLVRVADALHGICNKTTFAKRFPSESKCYFSGPIYSAVAKRDLGYEDAPETDSTMGQVVARVPVADSMEEGIARVLPPPPQNNFSPARLSALLAQPPTIEIDLTDPVDREPVARAPPLVQRNTPRSLQLAAAQSRRTVNAIEQSPSKERGSLFRSVVKKK